MDWSDSAPARDKRYPPINKLGDMSTDVRCDGWMLWHNLLLGSAVFAEVPLLFQHAVSAAKPLKTSPPPLNSPLLACLPFPQDFSKERLEYENKRKVGSIQHSRPAVG